MLYNVSYEQILVIDLNCQMIPVQYLKVSLEKYPKVVLLNQAVELILYKAQKSCQGQTRQLICQERLFTKEKFYNIDPRTNSRKMPVTEIQVRTSLCNKMQMAALIPVNSMHSFIKNLKQNTSACTFIGYATTMNFNLCEFIKCHSKLTEGSRT